MSKSESQVLTVAQLIALFGYPRFFLLMGLPGSGKSTLSALLAEHGYESFNADRIRAELYGDESIQGDREHVFGLLVQRMRAALNAGKEMVLDLTNLTRRGRADFVEMVRSTDGRLEILLLDVPYAVCVERNTRRVRQVPTAVLLSMAYTLQQHGLPQLDEGRLSILRPTEELGSYRLYPDGEQLLVMKAI